MTSSARKLLDQVLGLPEEDRLAIASALLESVEGSVDPGWEDAWIEELERRDRAASARQEPAAEWSEVRERIRRRLAER